MHETHAGNDWTSGYVGDVVYTVGFHRELAPTFLDYVCLINGVEGLPAGRALRYCELGCGRGYATTLLAAANPDAEFVGIDFNPAHIAEARALAERASLVNVTFLEMDFAGAARSLEPRLGEFDVVAMHGVYSWITPQVREDVHEFIRRKLRPGGIVFASYNAMPGWARVVPTQKLIKEAADRTNGDSLARAREGLRLMGLLLAKSDGMVAKHGALSRKYLGQLTGKDERYIAHEFLAAAWQPLFVTEAISALAGANLSYVGSAVIAENRMEFCVPKGLRETVRSAPDVAMRELIKDFIIGQQFRRDVYVKEPRRLEPGRHRQLLGERAFAPVPHVQAIPEILRAPMGSVRPKKGTLDAIWRRIDGRTATGADLVAAAGEAGESEDRAWAIIELLVHCGVIHPARSNPGAVDRAPGQRLNAAVMDLSRANNTHAYLASPVLGSAISTNLPERIIAPLLADEPELDDLAIAATAFDRVNGSGQDFMRDGLPVERSEENVQALASFVRKFRDRRLPRWRMLGIVD
jgi:SAM-dependent methyltransferase